jgi:hypothetical protein
MDFHKNIKFLFISLLSFFSYLGYGQEKNWESYLIEDVENINPVYKPVIGFGVGYMNFYGDVKNNMSNPLMGNLALKINMHAFIDQPKHYKFNVYVMSTFFTIIPGMTVNQRSYLVPDKNYNFQTEFLIFGANAHYDFDHFIKKTSFVRPFISIGFENINFSSKADLIGKYYNPVDKTWHPSRYYYWTDGTVRNRPQSDERLSYPVVSDDKYETDIRSDTSINNLGNYSQTSFAIPVDVGLEFAITNRTSIRMGYSYHFTFTDYIDGVTPKTKFLKGKSGTDKIGYTYLTMHFDLFSDPKMLRLSRLLAMVEDFDYDLLGDEDGDMVLDINDKCLHTPKEGLPVDTLGCSLDTDGDGVPDYLDKQSNTPAGAIADKDGVEIPEALVWETMNQEALLRPQVELYLSVMNNLASGSSRRYGKVEIPEKFKNIDLDGDGYIAFDEVLKAIDAFFDFDSDLTTQDIYDLNDFFFSQ